MVDDFSSAAALVSKEEPSTVEGRMVPVEISRFLRLSMTRDYFADLTDVSRPLIVHSTSLVSLPPNDRPYG